MLGYYWVIANGRNYIIVATPDNRTVFALRIQRLQTNLVFEYEALELLECSEMSVMFERLREIEAADDSLK
jgi:hypothetical protein